MRSPEKSNFLAQYLALTTKDKIVVGLGVIAMGVLIVVGLKIGAFTTDQVGDAINEVLP